MKGLRPTILPTALLFLLVCLGFRLGAPVRAEYGQAQPSRKKESADLHQKVKAGALAERVSVIVEPAAGWTNDLDGALQLNGASDVQRFRHFNFRVATLPAAAAAALAARPDVAYVSVNRRIGRLGHVSLTTGADAVRATSGTTTSGLDGTGVGIAVLDSGIDTAHKSFLDKSNGLRVVHSQDFTGEGRTDDPYGHGTHVASMAAGNGRISNAQYIGIAPNATVVNLRVLNSQGVGTVSGLLHALDWVLLNHAA
ncbi:MAG TPA: S8 family serine peptidase, partial [Pyrinomonadaceae bacterium]|nr:S8 family serine peptidase [Pyrinomonadaceae bacterium]